MKKITAGIFVLMLVSMFFGYTLSGANKDLSAKNDSLLDTTRSQSAEIDQYKDTVKKLESSLDTEKKSNNLLTSENEMLENKARILVDEINVLRERTDCENQISWEVNYSSAGTVHKSLIRWIEEVESVVDSDYKTLWNNSKTSWHEIRGSEYLYYYVVFYDDPELGYRRGIFSVGCQGYVN
jgi:predicted RNase H-like nuclease (RuvC/YqgF family)